LKLSTGGILHLPEKPVFRDLWMQAAAFQSDKTVSTGRYFMPEDCFLLPLIPV
jgi:hypothetical protein